MPTFGHYNAESQKEKLPLVIKKDLGQKENEDIGFYKQTEDWWIGPTKEEPTPTESRA